MLLPLQVTGAGMAPLQYRGDQLCTTKLSTLDMHSRISLKTANYCMHQHDAKAAAVHRMHRDVIKLKSADTYNRIICWAVPLHHLSLSADKKLLRKRTFNCKHYMDFS